MDKSYGFMFLMNHPEQPGEHIFLVRFKDGYPDDNMLTITEPLPEEYDGILKKDVLGFVEISEEEGETADINLIMGLTFSGTTIGKIYLSGFFEDFLISSYVKCLEMLEPSESMEMDSEEE